MRVMRYANVVALAALLVGFGVTAWAGEDSQALSAQDLHELSGHVIFITPDTMELGTQTSGIVDLKITKDSEISPEVVRNDYVHVWYRVVPEQGNVLVRYRKTTPEQEQRGARHEQNAMGASSSSSGSGMQSAAGTSSSQPASGNGIGTVTNEYESSLGNAKPTQSSGSAAKQLPHTASSWPLVGVVGLVALFGAVAFTLPRLRG